MYTLRALQVFVAVADAGSFAAAARALNLAPAVVTRQVAELEAHLGARLIQRTTRRMVLTDVGAQYLARVRAVLADLADAEAEASAAVRAVSGQLTMRAPSAFTAHQLAAVLPAFHARYPQVKLALVVDAAVSGGVDDAQDITIVWGARPLEGDFVARRLARTEAIVAASPQYLARHGRPTHPRDLAGHQMLAPPAVPGVFDPGAIRFTHRDTQESFQPPRTAAMPLLATWHTDTNLAAARAGLGVAGLPSFVVAGDLASGRLERLLAPWRLMENTIWACVPSRRHLPARTRAMLDFLVETFGGEDRDPWLDQLPAVAGAAQGSSTSST